ncbi:MAG: hypothetical protein ACRDGD_13110 [Candidatus Limnocylindria bacterium]
MTDDPARRVASELERRGLAAPARLLADAHRPIGPLLTDLGAAVGPLLGAFGGRRLGDVRDLLDDERGLDRLVARLDPGDDDAGDDDAG